MEEIGLLAKNQKKKNISSFMGPIPAFTGPEGIKNEEDRKKEKPKGFGTPISNALEKDFESQKKSKFKVGGEYDYYGDKMKILSVKDNFPSLVVDEKKEHATELSQKVKVEKGFIFCNVLQNQLKSLK